MRKKNSLYSIWQKRLRKVRSKAEIARAFAVFQVQFPLYMGIIMLSYVREVYAGSDFGFIALHGVICLIISASSAFWGTEVKRHYTRRDSFLTALRIGGESGFVALSKESVPAFQYECLEIARKIGLNAETLRFCIDIDDGRTRTSIVKSNGLNYVLFSNGLFKLLAEDPEAAKTIALHELIRAKQNDSGEGSTIPLPKEVVPEFQHHCLEMARRIGLSAETLRFCIDTDDARIGARTIESRGLNYILFSNGFFKLLAEDPEAAKAIVAHELGHVVQRDSAAWLFVDSFIHIFPIRMAAMAAGTVVVSIVFQAIFHWHIVVGKVSFTTGGLNFKQLRNVLPAVIAFAIYWLYVRFGRRESERLADMAAVLLVSVEGLISALNTAELSSSQNSEFTYFSATHSLLSIHPSRKWRQRQAERLAHFSREVPAEVSNANPSIQSRWFTRKEFRWAMVFGVAAVVLATFVGLIQLYMDAEYISGPVPDLWKRTAIWISYGSAFAALYCFTWSLIPSSNSRIRTGSAIGIIAVLIGVGLVVLGGMDPRDQRTGMGLMMLFLGGFIGFLVAMIGYMGREVEY